MRLLFYMVEGPYSNRTAQWLSELKPTSDKQVGIMGLLYIYRNDKITSYLFKIARCLAFASSLRRMIFMVVLSINKNVRKQSFVCSFQKERLTQSEDMSVSITVIVWLSMNVSISLCKFDFQNLISLESCSSNGTVL